MSVTASKLAQMMKTLTEEDYSAVIKYVEFLISSRKQTTKATIQQIQEMFADNKGWDSEEEMLSDMAVLQSPAPIFFPLLHHRRQVFPPYCKASLLLFFAKRPRMDVVLLSNGAVQKLQLLDSFLRFRCDV